LIVTPPFERLDIRIPEDLADEVGRLYGYENIVSKELPVIDPTPIDNIFYASEKAKNILVSQGFSETLLYTLVPKGVFEVSYPLASDKSALRETISGKLKESLVFNARNADLLGVDAIKIFEIGKIFPKSGEKTSLCLGVLPVKKKKGVTSESILKEAISSLGSGLGISLNPTIETGTFGAIAEIDFDDALKNLEIPHAATIKDLEFKPLPKSTRYSAFSHYPFITRDIAIFVPSSTKEDVVMKTITMTAAKSAGKLLVKGPDLFDKFEKGGKVSYAFRMIFQSFEKTLSDEDANRIMDSIYKVVKAKKWEVR
jgi:phenylalanyl-tRNA synthetase beta chain